MSLRRTTIFGVSCSRLRHSAIRLSISVMASRRARAGRSLRVIATAVAMATLSISARCASIMATSFVQCATIASKAAAVRLAASLIGSPTPAAWPSAKALAFSASSSAAVKLRRIGFGAGAPFDLSKSVSNRNLLMDGMADPASVDQLVVAAALVGDDDLVLGSQLLGQRHHIHLRLVHVAQPHRAQPVDLLAQEFAGAFRHVGEEQVAQRLR